jgi:hypothetical protein
MLVCFLRKKKIFSEDLLSQSKAEFSIRWQKESKTHLKKYEIKGNKRKKNEIKQENAKKCRAS